MQSVNEITSHDLDGLNKNELDELFKTIERTHKLFKQAGQPQIALEFCLKMEEKVMQLLTKQDFLKEYIVLELEKLCKA